MKVIRIASLETPELRPYGTLRQHEEHRRAGIFVAEGDKVVKRLLESRFGVLSVLLPERRLVEFKPLISARAADIPVYVMEIAELEKLTGFPFFQGVLAVGQIPSPTSLRDLIQGTSHKLLVAVDGLTNAENVGLIVRNCAAFGASGLIMDRSSASPFLRRAVRNSMGTIFKLPVAEVESLPPTLSELKRHKISIVAAHPQPGGRTLFDTSFRRNCCIVLGSEGTGISAPVLEACDEAVAIPMSNEVDSLNVGSAAAVFLYEAARARMRAD